MSDLAIELRAIPGIAQRLEGLETADFRKRPRIRVVGTLDAPGVSTQFVEALKRFDERAAAAVDQAA